jgi:hypothetical protein
MMSQLERKRAGNHKQVELTKSDEDRKGAKQEQVQTKVAVMRSVI